MSLFQVEGWNLPEKVAGGPTKGSNEGKKKKSADLLKKKEKTQQENRKIAASDLQDLYEGKKDGRKRKNDDSSEKESVKPSHGFENQEPVSKKSKSKSSKTKVNNSESAAKPTEPASAPPSVSTQKLTPLQLKMKEKLTGARFRWINEQLYTTTSETALKLIQESPDIFDEYHEGFRSQVKSWPENPVDTLVSKFKERLEKPINAPGGLPGNGDGTVVVADMGCGEAQLARDLYKVKGSKKTKKLKFQIHSFDLKKANELITVADIKNVPLPDQSCHVVVFCLALMGTNFLDFVKEALRILKPKGELWIAEIKSRFVNADTTQFVDTLKSLGLFHKATDDSNKMFVRFEFFKPPKDILDQRQRKQESRKPKFIDHKENADEEKGPEGTWLLKPCIYKRR
ncbi:Rrp8p [Sugiyamaella lignohabitans]|uniref:Ribosomal RNA-processing protein 8 n=1 Tax=Sugiyamaella lignohabitans TaxID=796027 RepID=A0A161HG44_9ASCO|nr:Rrp8p [Sugiyamaella lignohabitans]ANB11661.1 Rrp8p [Sugiyamaella lignohabitans]